MAFLKIRRFHAMLILIACGAGYLFLSPCASNDTRIINGTGKPINVVMRVGGNEVWTGNIDPSDIRDAPFMHPGGEEAIDIQVTSANNQPEFRGEFGLTEPYGGDGHFFLVDYQGIHYATIFPQSDWEQILAMLEMLFRPLTARICCAGPDWL